MGGSEDSKSGFAQHWIVGSKILDKWKRCPIFFIFWQPSFIWATLVWKSWCLGITSENEMTRLVLISIYSYTFKSHLLLYECPCISPSLPTVHLPGQQQRKPRLTEGSVQQHTWRLQLSATFCRLPAVNIILDLQILRLTLPWTFCCLSLTHPRSQQSRSLSQAQDLVSLAHK